MNRTAVTRMQVYQYVINFIEEWGYGPSIRQIMEGVGIRSTSVVSYHLGKLEELGMIRRERSENGTALGHTLQVIGWEE